MVQWQSVETLERKRRMIRRVREVSGNDKEEVRCRPDACADGTICQTHLSSSSPAATSLIIITTAWWMDLCGGMCQVWVNSTVSVWCQPGETGRSASSGVLSLDNCGYVVGPTQQHTYASGQRRISFPHLFGFYSPCPWRWKVFTLPGETFYDTICIINILTLCYNLLIT